MGFSFVGGSFLRHPDESPHPGSTFRVSHRHDSGTFSAAPSVLLVLRGCAGALWGPAEQLMLHDFVGTTDLPSAVRLNATFRSLGILFGPVVGSALLLGLGATAGVIVNVAIYLPLTLFLFRTRFTGHVRDTIARQRVGLRDSFAMFRSVRDDRTLVANIVLAGLGAFFIGASVQAAC